MLLVVRPVPLAAQQPEPHPFVAYRYDALPLLNRESGQLGTLSPQVTGTAWNHTGMAGVEFPSLPVFSALQGVFRLGFEVSSGHFSSDPYTATNAINPGTSLPVPSDNTSSVEVSSMALRLDLRLAPYADNHIIVFSGLWASWLFSTDAVLREQIVSPDGAVFAASSTSERLITTDSDLLGQAVRYGPMAGLAWILRPTGYLTITPELSLSFDARAGSISRGLGAGAGIAFSYASTPAIPDKPKPLPPPVASVNLFATDTAGVRSDTARIQLRSALHRRYLPLMPFLLPDTDNPASSGQYYLLTTAEADTFSIESCTGISLTDFYRHTLNIVGQRLRAYPQATLSLAAPVDNIPLRNYAETVRRYLTGVWHVDSARLSLALQSPDRAASGPTLLLRASSPALLAPIVVQWVEENVTVPTIGMEKYIEAEAGLDRWQVVVRQAGTRLAVFSGNGEDHTHSMSSFPIYGLHVDSLLAPVTAELTAIDSAGRRATGLDTLPLAVTGSNGSERRTYCFAAPVPGTDYTETVNNALLTHLLEYTDSTTILTVDFPSRQDSEWSVAFAGEQLLALLGSRGIRPARIHISAPPATLPAVPTGTLPLPAVRITAEHRRY